MYCLLYPFNTTKLLNYFIVKEQNFTFTAARLMLGNIMYSGPPTINKFVVNSVKFCNATYADGPYVIIQFTFTRNLIGSLLNDFLPFLICSIIGHTTIYYNKFEVALGTNLTLLLVLVTL
jgi:hypothetical protein